MKEEKVDESKLEIKLLSFTTFYYMVCLYMNANASCTTFYYMACSYMDASVGLLCRGR